jgi:hypothetical protein
MGTIRAFDFPCRPGGLPNDSAVPQLKLRSAASMVLAENPECQRHHVADGHSLGAEGPSAAGLAPLPGGGERDWTDQVRGPTSGGRPAREERMPEHSARHHAQQTSSAHAPTRSSNDWARATRTACWTRAASSVRGCLHVVATTVPSRAAAASMTASGRMRSSPHVPRSMRTRFGTPAP